MSLDYLRRLNDLEKQLAIEMERSKAMQGALEGTLAAVSDLANRIKALEEKRGPGRPPNGLRAAQRN